MTFLKISWLFSRRRLIIASIFDYIILAILLTFKKNIYQEYLDINIFRIFCFGIIWTSLSYIFGVYVFRYNLFILDSLKLCIKNSCKLIISFIFIYLTNSIFIKLDFLSSRDNLFSINFIVLFIVLTTLLHILLIFLLHRNDSKEQKWILIGPLDLSKILNNKINNSNYKYQIISIDSVDNLYQMEFKNKDYVGIIFYSDLAGSQIDLEFLKNNNLIYYPIKDWCQIYIQRFPPEIIKPNQYLKIHKLLNEINFEIVLKRIADIILSTNLLILLSPVLLIVSLLIFIEDFGPILYSQLRTGQNLTIFRIYKLRSMRVNSEQGTAKWASNNDIRISKVGKFIRSTRIDELPQLWSVLKGEMSLIGPRPERPEFDKVLSRKIPNYLNRYNIKPGLSGWAQVNYPYGASEEDARNKLSYDLYYLENFSIFLDFLILFKTIKLVLNAKGSEKGSNIF